MFNLQYYTTITGTRTPGVGHEIPTRPWSKVATDLFVYNGDNFVVIVDYYSNFIEVERVKNTSSQSVIQVLKTIFGHHGIPDTVVSDNGPTYASEKFTDDWEFSHVLLPHTIPSPMARLRVP